MDIEKITPENYNVPKGEERSYHCIIEVVDYDRKTGKKVSRPRIQKFGQKMFEAHIYSSLKKQGYTVTILHDPKKWIAEQKEIAEKKAAERAAAKAKAEAEARAAEKAALKAELLAELKAEQGEMKTGGRQKK